LHLLPLAQRLRWLEEVLAIISLKDKVEQIRRKRHAVQEKLLEMESLVVPAADAAKEAGKLILNMLWIGANQEERRKLLLSMLDAVYVDAKKLKSIIAIKPKPPFRPVFQVAASRKGSNIRILNEPLEGSSVFCVM